MTDAAVPAVARLDFNGVDAGTGALLVPSTRIADMAAVLRGDDSALPEGRLLRRRRQADEDHFGVLYPRDPQDLASAGWGLVVPDGVDPALLDAVEPLRRLRREQAGELFRRLDYRSGESALEFLRRHGMGPGPADPRRVPYYLALLGTPAEIPFEVQHGLGVMYAVGRIDLGDAAAVAVYAARVVAAEADADAYASPEPAASSDRDAVDPAPSTSRRRRLQVFATANPGDAATALSLEHLAIPLRDELRDSFGTSDAPWAITETVGEDATRARLEASLTESDAPDILFTATHGLGGRATAERLSGSLLCQDWPGPDASPGPVPESMYLAADHLSDAAVVRPRLVFSFACFGAGTPTHSMFPGGPDGSGTLADRAFSAHLPGRLLGGDHGGALAVVGHVDRAWSFSFSWPGLASHVTPFSGALLQLMDGYRVGSALESITSRSAQLSDEYAQRVDEYRTYGRRIADEELVGLWTARQDARAYVVLGDPAVRIAPRGAAGLRRG